MNERCRFYQFLLVFNSCACSSTMTAASSVYDHRYSIVIQMCWNSFLKIEGDRVDQHFRCWLRKTEGSNNLDPWACVHHGKQRIIEHSFNFADHDENAGSSKQDNFILKIIIFTLRIEELRRLDKWKLTAHSLRACAIRNKHSGKKIENRQKMQTQSRSQSSAHAR